jgi:hypothetical protein
MMVLSVKTCCALNGDATAAIVVMKLRQFAKLNKPVLSVVKHKCAARVNLLRAILSSTTTDKQHQEVDHREHSTTALVTMHQISNPG